MNQVDIEVVAEDGTSQIYCIDVIKLSASTAKLEDLIVSPDTELHPTFSANTYEYSCKSVCHVINISIHCRTSNGVP